MPWGLVPHTRLPPLRVVARKERAVDPKHCRNIAGGSRIVRY